MELFIPASLRITDGLASLDIIVDAFLPPLDNKCGGTPPNALRPSPPPRTNWDIGRVVAGGSGPDGMEDTTLDGMFDMFGDVDDDDGLPPWR